MRRFIVAVDPGGSHTGIVVRSDTLLHWHALVDRNRLHQNIDPYLHAVCDTIAQARDVARNLALTSGGQMVVAVEDIVDPTPQMGTIAVRGVIDTAQILGGVAAKWAVTRVPPAGHGLNPLHVYPIELSTPVEVKGTGRLRHCRAAWDIAYHANTLLTVEAAK